MYNAHRFWTAAQALFGPGRLGLSEPPAKAVESKWILIYGASSMSLSTSVFPSTVYQHNVNC